MNVLSILACVSFIAIMLILLKIAQDNIKECWLFVYQWYKEKRSRVKLSVSWNRLIKKAELKWDTYGDAILVYGRRGFITSNPHIVLEEPVQELYHEITFICDALGEDRVGHVYTNVRPLNKVGTWNEIPIYECTVERIVDRYVRTNT